MKYFFIITIFIFAFSSISLAQENTTPTPLPSQDEVSTDSADLEKIKRIKDIVASRVAELNLVEKRGIVGKILEVSTTQATIEDLSLNKRLIDIDELTKFESSDDQADDFGVSDLEVGKLYSFVGLYNRETKRLLARFIDDSSIIPTFFEGIVAAIDEDEFQLSVINEEGEEITVDIERSTKTSSLNEESKLEKSGFSQIKLHERIVVIGFSDLDDEDLINASRIIHFLNIPPSKRMQQYIQIDGKKASEKDVEESREKDNQ